MLLGSAIAEARHPYCIVLSVYTLVLLPHESDKSRKLLFETRKTGLSSFVDPDDSQGCCRHSTTKLLLWPIDVWIEDRQEPR
jgi:hypothetical protein